MCLSRRLHVLLLFLSHFSFFFLSLRRSSSLLRVFSSVTLALSFSLFISLLRGVPLPPCDTTACNGLKGLHSNNRETNCRALARYRASPVGRPRLAARARPAPALVYHRSFCYGDVPLFSPRFRDSFTLLPP